MLRVYIMAYSYKMKNFLSKQWTLTILFNNHKRKRGNYLTTAAEIWIFWAWSSVKNSDAKVVSIEG